MTLSTITLAVLLAGGVNVRSIHYHRDERGAAFSAELAVPGFVAGYEKLVPVSKDGRTFLLYATFDTGRERDRPTAAQLEEQCVSTTSELARLDAVIAAFKKAFKDAKAKGAKQFKAPLRYHETTVKLSQAPAHQRELDSERSYLVESLKRCEEGRDEAKRAEQEGPTAYVYGRFKESGQATVEVLRAPARGTGPAEPAVSITLQLPEGPTPEPEVLAHWAEAQASALTESALHAPRGTAFQSYAVSRAADMYGGGRGGLGVGGTSRHEVDLYGVMTGLAAVQEALQLDAMTRRRGAERPGPKVKLSALKGPDIASHDYETLRRGAEPKLFDAAAAIPADAFALHFTSANAVFQVLDLIDDWGTDLAHALEGFARDRGTKDRLFTQLALPRDELTRMYASRAIDAVTIIGHDPFVREGTDLTLVLTVKDMTLVRLAAEHARAAAKGARKDAQETSEKHQGVTLTTLQTRDRAVSTTYAESGKFAFIGNSPAGVKAALDTQAGRRPSLAKAPDFRYIRTLFEGQEDAFAFLSDAFVRSVVGPRWKVGAKRRLECATHLQMIEYAALLARRERVSAPTLEDLEARGYVPKGLACGHGGRYALGEHGASCSVHGRLSFLTPLVELPFDEVTAAEGKEYVAFVEDYKNYWRQYVDPVGVRVKLGPPVDIETIILPLVDNTIYTGLREFYAKAPSALTHQGETGKTIVALSTTLSPSVELQRRLSNFMREMHVEGQDPWRWLGDQASLVIYDGDPFLTIGGGATAMLGARLGPAETAFLTALLSSLTLPTALVVKVKDPDAARAAFERVAETMQLESNERSRREVEVTGYRLSDTGGGDRVSVLSITFFGINLRLYVTVMGDQLYLATRRWLVDEMLARGAVVPKDGPRPEPGHLRLRVEHAKLKSALPAIQAGWGESMREACFQNFGDLAMVGEATGPTDPVGAVRAKLAYTPYCPAGGRYSVDPRGEVSCSVHGRLSAPHQPRELADATSTAQWLGRLEEIDLSLEFTREGLRTHVRLTPKSSPPR